MGNRRVILSLATVAVLVPLLAGCHPDVTDVTSAPTSKPTVKPTNVVVAPTPTPTVAPAVFVQPTNCEQMLGADLLAQITSNKTELFSSSDGTGIYYPHDSKQQNGFQCQYGVNYVDYSTFEFDTQPITSQQGHEGVIDILSATGMPHTVDGDVVTYTQIGDEGSTQLYIHQVRPDSWITVWASLGGQQQFDKFSGYLTTIAQQVYKTP